MEQFETDEPLKEKNDGKKDQKSGLMNKFCYAIPIVLILGVMIFLFMRQQPDPSKLYTVLVGDIGGTHVRLRLLSMSKDINIPAHIIETKKLITAENPSLEGLLQKYISGLKEKPVAAVIGVPGPIKDNKILALANIPQWNNEDGNVLGQKLGLKKFIFLNDFACNSYGIQTNLKKDVDYITLNDVPAKEGGPKAIIGPGTGLGMGYLMKGSADKYYTIGNSEGGHQDFAPKNKKYFELAEFVKKEYNVELLDIERVCSGHAMIPFYRFIHNTESTVQRDPELAQKVDNLKDYSNKVEINKINLEITQKGLRNECPLSRKVLELFIEILGEAAGDMSLFTLPTNGIYLLGGISVAIEDLIKSNKIFMEHFVNKNLAHLNKDVPVYLVKNPEIGMIGAAECARRILEDEF